MSQFYVELSFEVKYFSFYSHITIVYILSTKENWEGFFIKVLKIHYLVK